MDDGNLLDAETGRLLASIADRACDNWQRPDSGMWELEEQQHCTSSKLGCWQALDCAMHLAEHGQLPGGTELWTAGALACVGRMEEAKARMGELMALGNDVGLCAEMMDAENNEFHGNLPQGLSHLALINAAIIIDALLVG